jgi:hypothetical protein
MKCVIHRTKGELQARKELVSHLQSLGMEMLTGLGDTERRIQRKVVDKFWGNKTPPNRLRLLCTAAWLHPAGSALMYLHYREMHQKRGVSTLFETWGVKHMLGVYGIAEEIYSGRWRVAYERIRDNTRIARRRLGALLGDVPDDESLPTQEIGRIFRDWCIDLRG